MALAHFRMFIHKLLNKDPYIFPEEYPLIILDIKSAMYMENNGKDTKHTSQSCAYCTFNHSLQNTFSLQFDLCVWYPYHYFPYT